MASLLKEVFNRAFLQQLSALCQHQSPAFNSETFLQRTQGADWEQLELKARVRCISQAFRCYRRVNPCQQSFFRFAGFCVCRLCGSLWPGRPAHFFSGFGSFHLFFYRRVCHPAFFPAPPRTDIESNEGLALTICICAD